MPTDDSLGFSFRVGSMREINEHNIRLFLHALEDDLSAIWRNVEIPNVEVWRKICHLALRSRASSMSQRFLCWISPRITTSARRP